MLAYIASFTDSTGLLPFLLVLLDASFKSALLLALASTGVVFLRRASAATRHAVWSAALAGVVILPLLSLTLPSWRVAVPGADRVPAMLQRAGEPAQGLDVTVTPTVTAGSSREAQSTTSAPSAPTTTRVRHDADVPPSLAAMAASLASAPASGPVDVRYEAAALRSDWSVAEILVALWVAGVLVALLPLLLGAVQLWRIARTTRDVDSDVLDDFAAGLARSLGIRRVVRLVEGAPHSAPMTWGTLRPVIMLPGDFSAWPDEQQRTVLLHELAHVARFDCLTHFVARVACALYWFNPLAWIAARSLRVERERSCDDRVLLTGARASTYADHLLTIARTLRAPGATPAAALAMARPSQLEGRLLAVLDARRPRGVVTRGVASLAGAAAFIAAAALAVVQPWSPAVATANEATPAPRSPEPAVSKAPVAAAPRTATPDTIPQRDTALVTTSTRVSIGQPGTDSIRTSDGKTLTFGPGSVVVVDVGADAISPTKFKLPGCTPNSGNTSSAHVTTDDEDHIKAKVKRDQCEIGLEAHGTVQYNDAFTDVASLSRGGWLEIWDKGGPDAHHLLISEENGALKRTFKVDNEHRPYDAEAAKWLATTLVELDRFTGFSKGARLNAIYKEKGVEGVLDETKRTSSDYSKRESLARLFKLAQLDEAQLGRVLDLVRTDVDSDYEQSEILRSLLKEGAITPALQLRYIAAARSVESGYERSRALKAISDQGALTAAAQSALYEAAASMSSDYERGQLMGAVAKKYGVSKATGPAVLAAAARFSSDYDLRTMLTTTLRAQPDLDESILDGFLSLVSRRISSDYDKAEFLVFVTNTRPGTAAERERIEKAAESIKSEYDYGRVMSALRKRRAPTTSSL